MAEEIIKDANTASVERREAAKTFLEGDTTSEAGKPEPTDEDEPVTPQRGEEIVEEEEEKPEGESGEEGGENEEESEEEPEGEEGEGEETEEEDEDHLTIDGEEVPREVVETHHKMVNDLVEALDGTDYPINFTDDDGNLTEESAQAGMEELGARLADSHAFYSVLDGTAPIDNLFGRIKQFQGDKVHDFVAGEALKYFVKIGLVDGPDTTINQDGDIADPVLAENARLKKELAQRGNDPQQKIVQERRAKIFNAAVSELKRLGADEDVDEDLINDSYLPAMAKAVSGDKAVINRIARGNFVDIKRIFDTHHNRIVGVRTKVNNKKVGSRKIRDSRVPKNVAGGDKPGAAASNKTYDLSTRDGRIAAAKANLRG